MPVLNFPQKYMLLSQSWGFAAASNAILTAMVGRGSEDELKKLEDMVQRWRKGANANLKPAIVKKYIKNLGDHFESTNTFALREITQHDFEAEMSRTDDMAFVDFLGRTSTTPRLVGVLPREQLKGMLAANRDALVRTRTRDRVYFFYRLGFNAGNDFVRSDDKLKFRNGKGGSGEEASLVIRRIPVRLSLSDQDMDHFLYEEHYVDELSTDKSPFTSVASAYVFQHFLTVVSKDRRETAGGQAFVEVSVSQVDLKQGLDSQDGWFPGVVTMRSDCSPNWNSWNPTSYRFVLRPAPDDMGWEDENGIDTTGDGKKKNAKLLSRTVKVLDMNSDGKIDAKDFKRFPTDEIDTPETWAKLFKKLQVQDAPADLLVAHRTVFS